MNSDDDADEAELLGQHREHEVGRLDGQEVALRLRAVGQALAHPAAGADRDLRLVELVAGALDVGCGVEEREQPLLLVVVEDVGPRDRDQRDDPGGEDRPATSGSRRTSRACPARIAPKTSDVPRSGWSITRMSGGPTSRQAPRIEPSESRRPWRAAR